MNTLKVVNFGGGLQTCLIAELVICGSLPTPDLFIFADTGNEPHYVYKQVHYYKNELEKFGVPFFIVNNGNMENDLYSGKRFAAMPLFTSQKRYIGKIKSTPIYEQSRGMMKRQCTSEYKIVPIERHLKKILLERGWAHLSGRGIRVNKDVIVESWIGFTVDEIERVKPSRNTWQKMVYPLLNMRFYRADCEQWFVNNGKTIPKSSACIYCPLLSISRQKELRDTEPASFEKRAKFDRDLRNGFLRISATAKGDLYLSDTFLPIDQINLDGADNQLNLFGCDNGHCIT